MIVKPAVAGALVLASLPGGLTKQDFGPDNFVTHPYVKQVICEKSMGTAFKIDTGQWISANHVSANGGCRVDGHPAYVVHADPAGDFSIIDFGDKSPGGMPVDCGGFVKGQWYYGIGYAWGYLAPQSKAVQHSGFPWLLDPHWNTLTANRFAPGMSGGVVEDIQGRAVGTVNAYGVEKRTGHSRALKDTIICQGSAAQ